MQYMRAVYRGFSRIIILTFMTAIIIAVASFFSTVSSAEETGAKVTALLAWEIAEVTSLAVLAAIVARCFYGLVTYPWRWNGTPCNPIQWVMVPGADEAQDQRTLFSKLALHVADTNYDFSVLSDADKYLMGQLAEANSRRGSARLIGDAIVCAAIIIPLIFAFSPMAKSMLLGSLM